MNVTPVRSVGTPRYPTAEQVQASPGMLQPRPGSLAQRMALAAVLGSTLGVTGCVAQDEQPGEWPMSACRHNAQYVPPKPEYRIDSGGTLERVIESSFSAGVPCCEPVEMMREAEALRIIQSVLQLSGYRARPATEPVRGMPADLVESEGRFAIDWRRTVPPDPTLARSVLAGQRYLWLPPTPGNVEPPEGSTAPVLVVLDAIDREALREQVRDFIRWLESQH
ncbi:MAG: hypothetical protein AB7S36_10110 [Planctomycetota bacterium]